MDTITLSSLADLLAEKDLLAEARNLTPQSGAQAVCGADCDSRVVRAGHVFVCKGATFKPTYLASALELGAVAYLCDEAHADELARVAPGVPALVARELRPAMALVSAAAWGHPNQALQVVGITGTKGKSTVSYMLRAALDAGVPARRTALIGSIDTFDGIEEEESHNTTPEAPDLWRHLANARDTGLAYLDMEVSSQGLKYDRVLGLPLDVACFLNIGRDHISPVEHPDFEDYFQSKLKIFDQARVAVVNLDTDHLDEVMARARSCERVVTFSASGASGADVWATDVTPSLGTIRFCAHTPTWESEVELAMPGLFNVDNALATLAICEVLGVELAPAAAALGHASAPGRMELLRTPGNRVFALVDYAHNKLSYQRFFASVDKEFPGYRVIVVMGAVGGKAVERRVDLPKEAAKWADHLIYTEEDPGPESVADICQAMAAATPEGTSFEIILDRPEAIHHAVSLAYEGEGPAVVCLLAKGDETYQHVGNDYVPYRTDGAIFCEAVQEQERARA